MWGYCCLVLKRHAVELYDLSADEASALMKDMRRVAEALQAITSHYRRHPVILRHPDSGREILYVNPGITKYIIGMPRDESDDLLKQLHTHSTRPSYVYSHDWQLGDLVMFDTLGTLHRREAWDPTERRVMRQLSTLWDPSEATA
jgi:alpha-ketoglutarate-dependent taurine dioxygenase